MYGPTGAGAGRGNLGGMPTAPPMQPTFGQPVPPPRSVLAAEMRRRAGLPPQPYAKGGFVKSKVVPATEPPPFKSSKAAPEAPAFGGRPMGNKKPVTKVVAATKGVGPATAAENSKMATFKPTKPAPAKPRLENQVALPFGTQHAEQLGTSGPLATRSSKPVRKKFI